MTSYAREGQDNYNGVRAPSYNVLSYTWGYYKDAAETPLVVHGVDWPIPGIKKSHFSVETFHNAITSAARGVKHVCEWLWVDIACIPQRHDSETDDAKRTRSEEIGRQDEIFHRAKEAFAWFSTLKTTDLRNENESFVMFHNLHEYMQGAYRAFVDARQAKDFLDGLEEKLQMHLRWMNKVLEHRWLLSLWTLQEMVLRSDAFVLLDDGLLIYNENEVDANSHRWNFGTIKNDAWALRLIVTDEYRWAKLKEVECIAVSTKDDIEVHSCEGQVARIEAAFQCLMQSHDVKGLTALNVEIPNTAYSAAQHRRVKRDLDGIYGIVQTYGISCNPSPPGTDIVSQLCALEDEFGVKLVAKSPVLSQLFIHSLAEGRPRRSWLITQQCKVDDSFWETFAASAGGDILFNKFEVVESGGTADELCLSFASKAWDLIAFVEASSSSPVLPSRHSMTSPSKYSGVIRERYQGLMLDYHVSKELLGYVVDYFQSYESMSAAAKLLSQRYHTRCMSPKVVLLGSGTTNFNLPVVNYVALVLVPCSRLEHPPEPTKWERVGLMRWTETYNHLNEAVHHHLPSHHDFDCLIV